MRALVARDLADAGIAGVSLGLFFAISWANNIAQRQPRWFIHPAGQLSRKNLMGGLVPA